MKNNIDDIMNILVERRFLRIFKIQIFGWLLWFETLFEMHLAKYSFSIYQCGECQYELEFGMDKYAMY